MASHWLVPRRSARSVLPTLRGGWALGGMHRELDRLLDEIWSGFGSAAAASEVGEFSPRVDISETDDAYRVTAELPGLEEKDFDVSLEGDILTVRGEKRVEREAKREGYTHVETSSGVFQRAFRLPVEVDPDSVKATFRNGVLNVTLPKPEGAAERARTIPITTS
jgi:HSP20 family protein